MKKLELKQLPMTRPDGTEETLSYWVQINSLMRMPANPQAGADIEEIRSSIRVIDVLEKAGQDAKVVEFEDSDYEFLKTKIAGAKYTFADPAIVQFVDDVTKAGE